MVNCIIMCFESMIIFKSLLQDCIISTAISLCRNWYKIPWPEYELIVIYTDMFWNVKIIMPRRMISVMRHFPLLCIEYHYIVVMKQLYRKKFLEVSCLGFICFSKEVFFPSLQSIYHCAHRK